MVRVKVSTLESVDFVPMRSISALLLLSFRELEVNQDLISERQEVNEEGRSVEHGLVER